MKKRNLTFAILLLAVVCTAFGVSGTYARYITQDSGTGTATVAKWAAAVNGWDTTSGSKKLALTPISNPYVANDVIAPDSDAVGILNVNLTGTQVATDLMASLGTVTVNGVSVDNASSHFTTVLRVYSSDATDAQIQNNIAGLTENAATPLATLTSASQKFYLPLNSNKTALDTPEVRVAVGIHWIHDDETNGTTAADLTDGFNAWDTTVGKYTSTAPTIEATINLTAQQHVLSDGDPNA